MVENVEMKDGSTILVDEYNYKQIIEEHMGVMLFLL